MRPGTFGYRATLIGLALTLLTMIGMSWRA